MPTVDLDPCSSHYSTVKSNQRCIWELGQNGLHASWEGQSVFVNPPWSDIGPWANKAHEASSWCFLVLEDASTQWWKKLTQWPCFRFSFGSRVGFVPPPGIEASTNDRPACMVASPNFYELVKDKFRGAGRWWKSC